MENTGNDQSQNIQLGLDRTVAIMDGIGTCTGLFCEFEINGEKIALATHITDLSLGWRGDNCEKHLKRLFNQVHEQLKLVYPNQKITCNKVQIIANDYLADAKKVYQCLPDILKSIDIPLENINVHQALQNNRRLKIACTSQGELYCYGDAKSEVEVKTYDGKHTGNTFLYPNFIGDKNVKYYRGLSSSPYSWYSQDVIGVGLNQEGKQIEEIADYSKQVCDNANNPKHISELTNADIANIKINEHNIRSGRTNSLLYNSRGIHARRVAQDLTDGQDYHKISKINKTLNEGNKKIADDVYILSGEKLLSMGYVKGQRMDTERNIYEITTPDYFPNQETHIAKQQKGKTLETLENFQDKLINTKYASRIR